MVNTDKSEKMNTMLARLPVFTPYGWKCVATIVLVMVIGGIAIS